MLGIIWGSWIRDIKKTNKQTNRFQPISNMRLLFFKEWNRGLPRCTNLSNYLFVPHLSFSYVLLCWLLCFLCFTSPVRFTGSYTEAEWAEIGFRHKSGKNKKNLQMRLWNVPILACMVAGVKREGEGGFPLLLSRSFCRAPPSPSGLCLFTATPVRGLRTTRHADKLTHTSEFSLPSWRLFVSHIVTETKWWSFLWSALVSRFSLVCRKITWIFHCTHSPNFQSLLVYLLTEHFFVGVHEGL